MQSSQVISQVTCSFCGQQDNQTHPCRSQAFGLLNRLAQEKNPDPFNQIENLVFQGGGIKGIAYLGVLRSLFNDYHVREKLHRVAGSSAGSMAALYICLDLSVDQMEIYMNEDMLAKLETEPTVTVDGVDFSISEVFKKVLDFSGNYTQADVVLLLKEVIGDLLKDSLSWWQGPLASWFASGTIAEALGGFFAPSGDSQKTIRQRLDDLEKEIKDEEAKYNPDQNQFPQEKLMRGIRDWFFGKKPTLEDKKVFHHALGQLIFQTFLTDKTPFPNGWFPGNKVKEDLIKEPIRKGYELKGLPVPDVDTLTFADLASAKVGDKPAFKKLYVTSFNSITKRTEVFSVDHTPNVVVADAVRASMAIPAFFESVPIREKSTTNNKTTYDNRKMYLPGKEPVDTRYMDGGVLDNYPIWIFDDLQYCFGNDTPIGINWVSKQRIDIRNPFTIGVKLMECAQRKQFLNPYVDEQRLHMRALSLPDSSSIGKLLLTYFTASSEDNSHILRGDASRSIYVDNLGVSAISFNLSSDEKKDLQKAGTLAVRQFVNYAIWGKLSEIGQRYYPVQRPVIYKELAKRQTLQNKTFSLSSLTRLQMSMSSNKALF